MSLAKIAMNAYKARQMAEQAGLIPEGSWKWALRNLRDGRGDLLQGRELAEAKEGLGKIPNNLRQEMQSISRQFGHEREIATGINADGSLPPLRVGEKNEVDFDGIVSNQTTHTVHTHPHIEARKYYRNTNMDDPYRAENEAERRRLASIGYEKVTPSGYVNRATLEKHPDLRNAPSFLEMMQGGDYANMLHMQRKFNPNLQHVILDPLYGTEGVHKLRPHGLRSIYFKNQV